jgi:phosphate transport system ATP-binding protein
MPDDRGLKVDGLHVRGTEGPILKGINVSVRRGEILSIIGPAGAGKTTFLRSLNRMNDLDPDLDVQGQVTLDGYPVYGEGVDPVLLRRRVGMVFSVPVPLPLSVRHNLAFGPSLDGVPPPEISARIEASLRAAFLWDEMKDRLDENARNLSGGQQQRLCLARTLMLKPDVLLLDEPCSSLDPISTAKIEEALQELKADLAVILVTNNVKQAARASDRTAFFLFGELIECRPTDALFTNPTDPRTQDYIRGSFG